MKKFSQILIAALAALLLMQGCRLVDEDFSDCPTDQTFLLEYEMRLVTNLETELETQLSLNTDVAVASALRRYLSSIFTDFAHDAILSFYDAETDNVYLQRDTTIDDNSTSIQLKIAANDYHHTALANVRNNDAVNLEGSARSATIGLMEKDDEPLIPHRTGLFATRLDMEVTGDRDQTFSDTLHMVNCAAALVVDTLDSQLRSISVSASGFATGYKVYNNNYLFDRETVHRTDCLDVDEGDQMCFVSVNFPSPDPEQTRTIIDTQDPFVSADAQNSLWRFTCYVTLPDGSVTKSDLNVHKPLRAGQLYIIKVIALPNGAVQPTIPGMAVSCDITWNYQNFGDIPL